MGRREGTLARGALLGRGRGSRLSRRGNSRHLLSLGAGRGRDPGGRGCLGARLGCLGLQRRLGLLGGRLGLPRRCRGPLGGRSSRARSRLGRGLDLNLGRDSSGFGSGRSAVVAAAAAAVDEVPVAVDDAGASVGELLALINN